MAAENGAGPIQTDPAGYYKGSPQIPLDAISKQVGAPSSVPFDPAFPIPGASLVGTKPGARIVYRDIPIVSTVTTWTVPGVRDALATHVLGIFESSGQLIDIMMGDDRVQATLGSRRAGLFGREVRFRPANDSDAARECLDAWTAHWPAAFDYALPEIHDFAIFGGQWPGQLLWDTSGPVWKWYLKPWHLRYTYYHWGIRRFVALSQDGGIPIVPGNGKWILHAPHGDYRGWIRGAVLAIAEPWIFKRFSRRDWARFTEVHGMPTRVGICPASADPDERDAYQAQLANLGAETTLLLTQGVDAKNGGNSYDYRLEEAKDTAWEAFPGLRDDCDTAITLALRHQNLTTQITSGGSYAAALQHGEVAIQQDQLDNAAMRRTIHEQIARPFAYYNFGDPDLAPWTDWDVANTSESSANAEMFSKFGLAIEVLRRGGVKFKDTEELRRFASNKFHLDSLPDFDIVDPVSGGLGGGK